MNRKNISAALDEADIFMRTINSKMDGLTLDGEIRSRVFNGLLHLSLEHYGSIITLLRSGMSASAAALLRPQYEAVMRGLYFIECASEEELDSFTKGKDPKNLKTIVEKLDKKITTKKNPLTNFYNNMKNTLHGFTHGGLEQLQRRYSETELVSNYTEEECVQVMTLSHILAIFAATSTAVVAGEEKLASEFVQEVQRLKTLKQ